MAPESCSVLAATFCVLQADSSLAAAMAVLFSRPESASPTNPAAVCSRRVAASAELRAASRTVSWKSWVRLARRSIVSRARLITPAPCRKLPFMPRSTKAR